MSRRLDRTIPIGRTEYVASSIAHLLVSGPPDADEENAPSTHHVRRRPEFQPGQSVLPSGGQRVVGRLALRSRSVAPLGKWMAIGVEGAAAVNLEFELRDALRLSKSRRQVLWPASSQGLAFLEPERPPPSLTIARGLAVGFLSTTVVRAQSSAHRFLH